MNEKELSLSKEYEDGLGWWLMPVIPSGLSIGFDYFYQLLQDNDRGPRHSQSPHQFLTIPLQGTDTLLSLLQYSSYLPQV